MNAIILSIGDELLIGNTLNTNAHWLGEQMTQLGVHVKAHWTIADEKEIIVDYIAQATQQAEIILITGGLGPTNDDLTVDAIAAYFKEPLVFHNESWEHIKSIYAARGRELHQPSIKMAYLPQNAIAIHNSQGTAPGSMYFENGKMIVSMPGVPYEMKSMMELTVIPTILQKFELPFIIHTHIYTAGVGETLLADALVDFEKNLPSNFSLAYLPSVGKVRLRISGHGEQKEELKKISDALTQEAVSLIEKHVYSTEYPELAEVVGQMLRERELSIGTAESCTGGHIGHLLTSIPGSSDYFLGGIISYSNDIKISALDVQQSTLDAHGAVSEEVVREMLDGALQKLGSDIAIAVSGVAGPGGGTEKKPVGLVYIGVADKNTQLVKRLMLTKDRTRNIELSSIYALVLLRNFLLENYL